MVDTYGREAQTGDCGSHEGPHEQRSLRVQPSGQACARCSGTASRGIGRATGSGPCGQCQSAAQMDSDGAVTRRGLPRRLRILSSASNQASAATIFGSQQYGFHSNGSIAIRRALNWAGTSYVKNSRGSRSTTCGVSASRSRNVRCQSSSLNRSGHSIPATHSENGSRVKSKYCRTSRNFPFVKTFLAILDSPRLRAPVADDCPSTTFDWLCSPHRPVSGTAFR